MYSKIINDQIVECTEENEKKNKTKQQERLIKVKEKQK